jgi:hypothetical protein
LANEILAWAQNMFLTKVMHRPFDLVQFTAGKIAVAQTGQAGEMAGEILGWAHLTQGVVHRRQNRCGPDSVDKLANEILAWAQNMFLTRVMHGPFDLVQFTASKIAVAQTGQAGKMAGEVLAWAQRAILLL